VSTINPGSFRPSGGTSVSRTTARSAERCASIWVAGLLIAVAAIVGALFGILGRTTCSMVIIAGVLLLIAGGVAEHDRRANKVPSDGARKGGESDLGCFFILAILLLVAAAIVGLHSLPERKITTPNNSLGRSGVARFVT
jgi:hypothetical protein